MKRYVTHRAGMIRTRLSATFASAPSRWWTSFGHAFLERFDRGAAMAARASAVAHLARDVMLTSPALPDGCKGLMVGVVPLRRGTHTIVCYVTDPGDRAAMACVRDQALFSALSLDVALRRPKSAEGFRYENPARIAFVPGSATLRVAARLAGEGERAAARGRLAAWLRGRPGHGALMPLVGGDAGTGER